MSRRTADIFGGSHVLFACEGRCEQIVISKLVESDKLVVPEERVLDIARIRKATSIQDKYLNYDYEWPVAIARIVDSRREKFVLGNLYRDRYPVESFITHPEIEMLAIVREGKFDEYTRARKTSLKPSDYCKSVLGMSKIKTESFMEGYWDADSLVKAIREYARLAKREPREKLLVDLLREDA